MLVPLNLNDTDYAGGLSRLTRYGTMLTSHNTPKRARGKYKSNRRDRNDHRVTWSECVARTPDGKVFRFKPTSNVESTPKARKPNRRPNATVAVEGARAMPIHTSTVHSAYDEAHRLDY